MYSVDMKYPFPTLPHIQTTWSSCGSPYSYLVAGRDETGDNLCVLPETGSVADQSSVARVFSVPTANFTGFALPVLCLFCSTVDYKWLRVAA